MAELPWGADPLTLQEVLGPDGPPGTSGEWPLAPAFEGDMLDASSYLEERGGPPLARGAVRGLVADLAGRLLLASSRVLIASRGSSTVFSSAFGRSGGGGWTAVEDAYPRLRALRARIRDGWRGSVADFLERWAKDRDALGVGELVSVRRVGDVHHHGRAVLLLETRDGRGWAYKPRPVSGEALWGRVLDRVSRAGLDPVLWTPKVVERRGYGWMEGVVQAPLSNAGDREHLWLRMGALARIAQLLQLRDVSADNLVVAGAHPVVVDLEACLYPARFDDPRADGRVDDPTWSGLATLRTPSPPGTPAPELGALAGVLLRVNVDPSAHVLQLMERGYVAAAEAIHGAGPALLDDVLSPSRVGPGSRFLVRNTAAYMAMRDAMTTASSLAAAEDEWKAALTDLLGHAGRSLPTEIVAAERLALEHGDVPRFTESADHIGLMEGSTHVVGSFLDGRALARTRGAVEALAAGVDRSLERDRIRAALFVALPELPLDAAAVPEEHAPAVAGGWREAAVEGARDLVARLGPSPATTTALHYDALHDVWRLAPLDADLLTGSAGIAVVLAELARATGDEAARAKALLLAGHVAERLEAWAGGDEEEGGGSLGVSRGPGGWAFALRRVTTALGPDPARTRMLRAGRTRAAAAMGHPDRSLLTGTTGLRLGFSGSLAGSAEAPPVSAAPSRVACPGRPPLTLVRPDPRPAPNADAPLSGLRTAELLLAGERALARKDVGDAAAVASELVRRRRLQGEWLPGEWAGERFHLAAFGGLAGIVHFLLRLDNPSRVPSLLALDDPTPR